MTVYQAELDRKAAYDEPQIRPVISKLEVLQKCQDRIDETKKTIPLLSLTKEEEALLADMPGELPDADEGAAILEKQRRVVQHQAAVQGVRARLEGEKSKAESLSASISQLESVTGVGAQAIEEPKKSWPALILTGIVLAAAGAVLGVAVTPVLAAIAVVGLLICGLGMAGRSTYKKNLKAYEAFMQADSQQKEAGRKKRELEDQLTQERVGIASLEMEISEHESSMERESSQVSAWLSRWGQSDAEGTEHAIVQIMDHAESVRRLREKKTKLDEAQAFVSNQAAAVGEERAAVDAVYPMCAGKSISEALDILRSGEQIIRSQKTSSSPHFAI